LTRGVASGAVRHEGGASSFRRVTMGTMQMAWS
jgi:hypothetical protein